MAQFRYIVDDVDLSVAFCTRHLGFDLIEQFGPAMAILRKDDLDLWLAGPQASASKPMPDGCTPSPGGWNRIVVIMTDLNETVQAMRKAGANFRNDIVDGPGGKQILCNDPSGNVVEMFQPA
ncbi:MAG: VOC family protein [Pseudomonadota bacterium]